MKREDNDLMRIQILDAVIACKTDAAGAEVSLSQVACRAGISERTLNRYFPDKEMMLYSAATRYLQHKYDALSEQYRATDKASLTALDRLLLLIQLQTDNYRRDLAGAKMFVRTYTTALRTAVYRDLPASGYDAAIRSIFLDCVQDGIRDGSMRSDIVPLDIYLMVSSNYVGLVQRLIYFYSVDLSKEQHKRELLLVFNKYIQMLEEYLSAAGRVSPRD